MVTPMQFGALPSAVGRPAYDRSTLSVGIAHLGVGAFHRSHQAMYLDSLMNAGLAYDWAICGIGLLPGDIPVRDGMQRQNCAYTLVLKHPSGLTETRVIGSIVEYLFAPDDPAAVVNRLADPAIRLVTLTITEGGYNINQVTGQFDVTAPGVVHDIASPSTPQTPFGLVVEALRLRRERGVPPFTVQSCDNIPGNGRVARHVFSTFAALRDPDLGEWVAHNVSFPNSMVDRITPKTTEADRADLAQRFGIEDACPVASESFGQWVIEDSFPLGRPEWERVGAQLVQDVEPYELMKLRMLNAAHQALAYFGYLMGYQYVDEAASDPAVTQLLRRYWAEEAIPSLRPVPGVDVTDYAETLLDRFRNRYVRDTVARLCEDTSDRIPKFLLPAVRDRLAGDGNVAMSAAVVASWARYAEGVDEQGAPIALVDSRKDSVMAAAARQKVDPTAFIQDPELFGDLADRPSFVKPYVRALDLIHTYGAKAALNAILAR